MREGSRREQVLRKAEEAESAAAQARTELAEAEGQLAEVACQIASNGSLAAIASAWGQTAGIDAIQDGTKWNAVFALVAESDRDIAQAKVDAQEPAAPAADDGEDEWSSNFTGDIRDDDLDVGAVPPEVPAEIPLEQAPAISALLAGGSAEQAQAMQQ